MSSACKLPNHLMSYLLSSKSSYGFCDLEESSKILKEYATREFNAFLWISLIAITALLLEKVSKLFRLWSKARRIAGPPCSSFFGHNNFSSREHFVDLMSELHNKYGSVLKLWLGPTQPLVSIKDPALVKEVLLKAEDKLPFTGKAFRLAFGRSSLFFCSYDQAQKRRESLASQLNEKLHGKASVVPKNITNRIMGRIEDNMGKGSVDSKSISQHMAFTILGNTLFGDAFLEWSEANFYEELLMEIAKDASFWASYRVTPFWERGFWRYQSICNKLNILTQDIVHQCRKSCKLLHNVGQNFTDETSKYRMKAETFSRERDGHPNVREEPYGNIMCMMFHGCIATAGLIGSILDRLATNLKLQDQIYSEIVMVRQELAEDVYNVNEMVLLLATIYESARLMQAGPLLQRCSLKDDLILKNGVTVPAGAVLVVPVHLLQIDCASWGSDARKFNPYRFLSESTDVWGSAEDKSFTGDEAQPNRKSVILKDPNNNAAFLPFGSGIRACVGQKFVIQGVATLLASLLERYKVMLKPKSDNNSDPEIVFSGRNISHNQEM